METNPGCLEERRGEGITVSDIVERNFLCVDSLVERWRTPDMSKVRSAE